MATLVLDEILLLLHRGPTVFETPNKVCVAAECVTAQCVTAEFVAAGTVSTAAVNNTHCYVFMLIIQRMYTEYTDIDAHYIILQ
jgi:hypothetical protein